MGLRLEWRSIYRKLSNRFESNRIEISNGSKFIEILDIIENSIRFDTLAVSTVGSNRIVSKIRYDSIVLTHKSVDMSLYHHTVSITMMVLIIQFRLLQSGPSPPKHWTLQTRRMVFLLGGVKDKHSINFLINRCLQTSRFFRPSRAWLVQSS
jgi:hypothetical protein